MVEENIMSLHALADSDDASKKTLDVSCDKKDTVNESIKDTDETVDGVFAMEDLEQPEEEKQDAHTIATNIENGNIDQPQVRTVELVESLSISQCTMVHTIQSEEAGDDSAIAYENKELGIDENFVGIRRPQDDCNNKESSVRVTYTSLPCQSKRKLEEFLHKWSEWHAQYCGLAEDPADTVESGEETYFPALNVGSDRPSTVSFSMDVHVQKKQRKESLSLNLECSPLYERGYAVGLESHEGASEERGKDLREAPRCFNCGSYNHPLSGCPKPVDKAIVNSARKEFQSKKNQSGGPRIPTRYYQDSPGGKYDGLKPGALSAETRKSFGLGELDPPPWLNRMRELGYPPGYLDPEEENQPSGITIYGGEETREMDTRKEIQSNGRNSKKKTTVEFPGINGPIPKNADRNLWEPSRGPPVSDFPRNQSINRWSFAQDSMTNGNYYGGHGPRNHFEPSSYHFSLGSPPVPHQLYNYHPNDPFSPRGAPVAESPHSRSQFDMGRPFMYHNYGSF